MSTLSPERWREVSPQLDHALSLPERERAAWLAALRADQPELAQLLETLLAEHHALSQGKFMERGPAPAPGAAPVAGKAIGAYRLLSLIGQGGMGSVWLAERSDGRFQRRVAVKVLRLAVTPQDAERFKREGDILARFADPHIAELLDAGVTPDGEPYLVLEHVEGERIDEYCDRQMLDVEARIRLFLDVLSAVAQAHAHLIVHRDIKPPNVLVRNDGQVKLLDFGIAKLLEDEGGSAAATRLTLEGGVALTPKFAAPEQVMGGAVTTATDVYALGVLLYLLLTGQHPAGRGPHSPAELVKAITETEPPRASDAIPSTDFKEVAERRALSPERLRRLLRGDLDTIVAKALKKKPAERYASVTAFAEDLRRYLKHQPISARPETLAYRAVKFVRRNRTPVALASLTFAALVAGVTGTLIQAHRAEVQRDFAFRQLSRAEAVNDLNSYVLSDVAQVGKTFTVNDLLAGAERIVQRQQEGEISRAELLISIGRQHAALDEYQKARELMEEAHGLSRKFPDAATRARASCDLGEVLSRTGDVERGEAMIQEGLGELPEDPLYVVERVTCLLRGSEVAATAGREQDAVTRAQAGQRLVQESSFHSDSLELDSLIVLARAENSAGQRGEADGVYRRLVGRLEALGRDETRLAASMFNNWGAMLNRAGRPLDAERVLRRTIEIGRKGPGEDAVSLTTLANYGQALYELGRLEEADSFCARAYEKAKQNGDDIALSQTGLHRARIYRAQGNLARADAMLAEVEPLLRKSVPAGHIAFAILALDRAQNAQARGDLEKAVTLAGQTMEMMGALAKKGRASADYQGKSLVRISGIELQAGHTEEALADASGALPLLQKAALPGRFSADVGEAYLAKGRALQGQGKSEEAHAAFRSAAANLEDALGPDHPDSRAARQLAGPSQQ